MLNAYPAVHEPVLTGPLRDSLRARHAAAKLVEQPPESARTRTGRRTIDTSLPGW